MSNWRRIEPTKTTKVGWRTVTTKTFEMPDGQQTQFDVVHADGQEFVAVIGITDDKKVVIGREFLPGPEILADDLPGGFVDAGESLETAARREFLEETGYEADTVKYVGTYYKDKYLNATWHTFLATGCKKVREQSLETEEFIEIVLVSIDEFLQNAKTGKTSEHGSILMAYDELTALNKEDKKS